MRHYSTGSLELGSICRDLASDTKRMLVVKLTGNDVQAVGAAVKGASF
jgi:hypothetical protein